MTTRSYTGIGTAPPAGGVGIPGDPEWANVKLLIQPHAGDVGVAGLHDRGPDGRTATIGTGSVTITDDSNRSPIWGAYANPNSASVTYSDDAGLQFGTGDFCMEFIGNRSATGGFSEHYAYTANSPGTRHFQGYFYDGASWYWYRAGGSQFGSFEPGNGYDTANGPMVENITINRASGTTYMFWNGNLYSSGADSNNYNTNWSAFKLFTDGGGFFGGNMIAMRLSHVSRFTAAHNPILHGFPEAAA
jgi:hypothetical protein